MSGPFSGEPWTNPQADTTCPVCGLEEAFRTPRYWEICRRCCWEDDPLQWAQPDFWGGANVLSLHQSQQAWRERIDVCVWHRDTHLMSSQDYAQSDLGSRDQVLHRLGAAVPDLDYSDPAWVTLRRQRLYMEFVVGAAGQVPSLWVHSYGMGDAFEVLRTVCAATGWRALDPYASSGGNPSVFLAFSEQEAADWQKAAQDKRRRMEERLQQAASRGQRMIFTALTEIRSSKPVVEFVDIRDLYFA